VLAEDCRGVRCRELELCHGVTIPVSALHTRRDRGFAAYCSVTCKEQPWPASPQTRTHRRPQEEILATVRDS